MCKGGGGQTTVQKSDPWEGVQPYLKDIFQQGQNLYQSGNLSNLNYPALGVAPTTNAQFAGQQGMLQFGNTPLYQNTLGGMQGLYTQGLATNPLATAGTYAPFGQGSDVRLGFDPSSVTIPMGGQFGQALGQAYQGGGTKIPGTGDVGRQAFNQNLRDTYSGEPDYSNVQALTEAATQPMIEQFNEQILPSIGDRSIASGQFGGSRQGVAEGIASRGLTRSIGDISTRIADAERQRALQQQMQGLGIGAGLMGQQAGLENAMSQQALGIGGGLAGQQAGISADLLSNAANLGLQSEIQRGKLGLGYGNLAQGQQALAAGMAPQLLQTGLLPYQLAQDVGGQQQGQIQRTMDFMQNQYNTLQQSPWQSIQRYGSLIQPGSGLGGTTTTDQSGGGIGGALAGAAGGGLSMAALSMMAGNPISWPLVAAGAGTGLLGGLF